MIRVTRTLRQLRAPLTLAALLVFAAGCATVQQYRRERLIDPIMSFKAEAKENARKTKSMESREGSTGGNGGAGGGCACN